MRRADDEHRLADLTAVYDQNVRARWHGYPLVWHWSGYAQSRSGNRLLTRPDAPQPGCAAGSAAAGLAAAGLAAAGLAVAGLAAAGSAATVCLRRPPVRRQ